MEETLIVDEGLAERKCSQTSVVGCQLVRGLLGRLKHNVLLEQGKQISVKFPGLAP